LGEPRPSPLDWLGVDLSGVEGRRTQGDGELSNRRRSETWGGRAQQKRLPFEFFDHTGDIAVRLTAPTCDGLFAAACEAFCQAVTEPERVATAEPRTVKLRAGDIDTLLVDWLSELIYWFDADRWLARTTQVSVTTEGEHLSLQATVFGEPFDPARHPIKILIKAATYHGLSVKQTSDGWMAAVVFDI
jgi:SHS2 domain-containing protein